MSQFSLIEQIAFEDGRTLTIEQLPEQLQVEVHQYNEWTAEAARIQEELNQLNYRANMLSYARTAAFSTIQQLANDLDRANETHTPVIDTEAASTNPAASE